MEEEDMQPEPQSSILRLRLLPAGSHGDEPDVIIEAAHDHPLADNFRRYLFTYRPALRHWSIGGGLKTWAYPQKINRLTSDFTAAGLPFVLDIGPGPRTRYLDGPPSAYLAEPPPNIYPVAATYHVPADPTRDAGTFYADGTPVSVRWGIDGQPGSGVLTGVALGRTLESQTAPGGEQLVSWEDGRYGLIAPGFLHERTLPEGASSSGAQLPTAATASAAEAKLAPALDTSRTKSTSSSLSSASERRHIVTSETFNSPDQAGASDEGMRRRSTYRVSCAPCGFTGPTRDTHEATIEDEFDHTHPEWREILPVVAPLNYAETSSPAKTEAWKRSLRQLYPAKWFEGGGPLLTARHTGSRPVPGRGPSLTYDIQGYIDPRAQTYHDHGMHAGAARILSQRYAIDPTPAPTPPEGPAGQLDADDIRAAVRGLLSPHSLAELLRSLDDKEEVAAWLARRNRRRDGYAAHRPQHLPGAPAHDTVDELGSTIHITVRTENTLREGEISWKEVVRRFHPVVNEPAAHQLLETDTHYQHLYSNPARDAAEIITVSRELREEAEAVHVAAAAPPRRTAKSRQPRNSPAAWTPHAEQAQGTGNSAGLVTAASSEKVLAREPSGGRLPAFLEMAARRQQAQDALFGALLNEPGLFDQIGDAIDPDFFPDVEPRAVFTALRSIRRAGEAVSAQSLADAIKPLLSGIPTLPRELINLRFPRQRAAATNAHATGIDIAAAFIRLRHLERRAGAILTGGPELFGGAAAVAATLLTDPHRFYSVPTASGEDMQLHGAHLARLIADDAVSASPAPTPMHRSEQQIGGWHFDHEEGTLSHLEAIASYLGYHVEVTRLLTDEASPAKVDEAIRTITLTVGPDSDPVADLQHILTAIHTGQRAETVGYQRIAELFPPSTATASRTRAVAALLEKIDFQLTLLAKHVSADPRARSGMNLAEENLNSARIHRHHARDTTHGARGVAHLNGLAYDLEQLATRAPDLSSDDAEATRALAGACRDHAAELGLETTAACARALETVATTRPASTLAHREQLDAAVREHESAAQQLIGALMNHREYGNEALLLTPWVAMPTHDLLILYHVLAADTGGTPSNRDALIDRVTWSLPPRTSGKPLVAQAELYALATDADPIAAALAVNRAAAWRAALEGRATPVSFRDRPAAGAEFMLDSETIREIVLRLTEVADTPREYGLAEHQRLRGALREASEDPRIRAAALAEDGNALHAALEEARDCLCLATPWIHDDPEVRQLLVRLVRHLAWERVGVPSTQEQRAAQIRGLTEHGWDPRASSERLTANSGREFRYIGEQRLEAWLAQRADTPRDPRPSARAPQVAPATSHGHATPDPGATVPDASTPSVQHPTGLHVPGLGRAELARELTALVAALPDKAPRPLQVVASGRSLHLAVDLGDHTLSAAVSLPPTGRGAIQISNIQDLLRALAGSRGTGAFVTLNTRGDPLELHANIGAKASKRPIEVDPVPPTYVPVEQQGAVEAPARPLLDALSLGAQNARRTVEADQDPHVHLSASHSTVTVEGHNGQEATLVRITAPADDTPPFAITSRSALTAREYLDPAAAETRMHMPTAQRPTFTISTGHRTITIPAAPSSGTLDHRAYLSPATAAAVIDYPSFAHALASLSADEQGEEPVTLEISDGLVRLVRTGCAPVELEAATQGKHLALAITPAYLSRTLESLEEHPLLLEVRSTPTPDGAARSLLCLTTTDSAPIFISPWPPASTARTEAAGPQPRTSAEPSEQAEAITLRKLNDHALDPDPTPTTVGDGLFGPHLATARAAAERSFIGSLYREPQLIRDVSPPTITQLRNAIADPRTRIAFDAVASLRGSTGQLSAHDVDKALYDAEGQGGRPIEALLSLYIHLRESAPNTAMTIPDHISRILALDKIQIVRDRALNEPEIGQLLANHAASSPAESARAIAQRLGLEATAELEEFLESPGEPTPSAQSDASPLWTPPGAGLDRLTGLTDALRAGLAELDESIRAGESSGPGRRQALIAVAAALGLTPGSDTPIATPADRPEHPMPDFTAVRDRSAADSQSPPSRAVEVSRAMGTLVQSSGFDKLLADTAAALDREALMEMRRRWSVAASRLASTSSSIDDAARASALQRALDAANAALDRLPTPRAGDSLAKTLAETRAAAASLLEDLRRDAAYPNQPRSTRPEHTQVQNELERPSIEPERILAALSAAADFYGAKLASPAAKPARDFLNRRAMGELASEGTNYRAGYAPRGDSGLLTHLTSPDHGFSIDELLAAGLVKDSSRSGRTVFRDVFRDRVMLAVHDADGRIVGFAGRRFDDIAEQKWINSAASDVYAKREILFGLAEQKHRLNSDTMLVLVEGYFDAVAVSSIDGYVGVSVNTSRATTEQLNQLSDLNVKGVLLGFDADQAGVKGTAQTYEALTRLVGPAAGRVPVIAWPEKDPAEIYLNGAAALRTALEAPTTPVSLVVLRGRLDEFAARDHGFRSIEGRILAARELLPGILAIASQDEAQAKRLVMELRERLDEGEIGRITDMEIHRLHPDHALARFNSAELVAGSGPEDLVERAQYAALHPLPEQPIDVPRVVEVAQTPVPHPIPTQRPDMNSPSNTAANQSIASSAANNGAVKPGMPVQTTSAPDRLEGIRRLQQQQIAQQTATEQSAEPASLNEESRAGAAREVAPVREADASGAHEAEQPGWHRISSRFLGVPEADDASSGISASAPNRGNAVVGEGFGAIGREPENESRAAPEQSVRQASRAYGPKPDAARLARADVTPGLWRPETVEAGQAAKSVAPWHEVHRELSEAVDKFESLLDDVYARHNLSSPLSSGQDSPRSANGAFPDSPERAAEDLERALGAVYSDDVREHPIWKTLTSLVPAARELGTKLKAYRERRGDTSVGDELPLRAARAIVRGYERIGGLADRLADRVGDDGPRRAELASTLREAASHARMAAALFAKFPGIQVEPTKTSTNTAPTAVDGAGEALRRKKASAENPYRAVDDAHLALLHKQAAQAVGLEQHAAREESTIATVSEEIIDKAARLIRPELAAQVDQIAATVSFIGTAQRHGHSLQQRAVDADRTAIQDEWSRVREEVRAKVAGVNPQAEFWESKAAATKQELDLMSQEMARRAGLSPMQRAAEQERRRAARQQAGPMEASTATANAAAQQLATGTERIAALAGVAQ